MRSRPCARLLLGLCSAVLVGCGRPEAQPARPAHPDPGPAASRIQAAGARGLAPAGDYVCVLRDPDTPAGADAPYGALSVRGDAYRLRLTGGGALAGVLHATPAGQLIWNGPLGPVDADPRRVSRARASGADDILSLVFDFAPALPGPPPRTQLVCRMTVMSDI